MFSSGSREFALKSLNFHQMQFIAFFNLQIYLGQLGIFLSFASKYICYAKKMEIQHIPVS